MRRRAIPALAIAAAGVGGMLVAVVGPDLVLRFLGCLAVGGAGVALVRRGAL